MCIRDRCRRCCGAGCARAAFGELGATRRPFGADLAVGSRGPLTPSRRLLTDAWAWPRRPRGLDVGPGQ
eukprot:3075726-Lingulodinium_polyedra.AAC.1